MRYIHLLMSLLLFQALSACQTSSPSVDTYIDLQFKEFSALCQKTSPTDCLSPASAFVMSAFEKASKTRAAVDKAIASQLLYISSCMHKVSCSMQMSFNPLTKEERLFTAVHIAYFNLLTTNKLEHPAPTYFFNMFIKKNDFESAWVSLLISTEHYSKLMNFDSQLSKDSITAASNIAFGVKLSDEDMDQLDVEPSP